MNLERDIDYIQKLGREIFNDDELSFNISDDEPVP